MWEFCLLKPPLCSKCESFISIFILCLLAFPLCSDGDMMWKEKIRPLSCLIYWCGNDIFPPTDTADSVLLPHVSHVVTEVQRVAWLIWPVVMLSKWNEPCGPVSAEKSQWPTLSPIKAFLNVEGSDSLRLSSGITLHVSESFPTPFTALTAQFIIYSCKQVLICVGFLCRKVNQTVVFESPGRFADC